MGHRHPIQIRADGIQGVRFMYSVWEFLVFFFTLSGRFCSWLRSKVEVLSSDEGSEKSPVGVGGAPNEKKESDPPSVVLVVVVVNVVGVVVGVEGSVVVTGIGLNREGLKVEVKGVVAVLLAESPPKLKENGEDDSFVSEELEGGGNVNGESEKDGNVKGEEVVVVVVVEAAGDDC